MGLSRPALIAYEKGLRTPGPTILYRLASALGVDVLKLTTVTLRTATMTDLRARAGFTKTELAEELHLRRHTYDRIERGARTPEPELVPQLARLLAVSERTVATALRRSRTSHGMKDQDRAGAASGRVRASETDRRVRASETDRTGDEPLN